MRKLLVIEDDISIRENTKELLELNGFEVLTANNGQEGLNLIDLHNFDLVLCDIHMPKVTGYDVFNKMKDDPRLKKVRIIFMSASVQHTEKAEAMKMGIDGFIEKPFNEQSLLGTINSVIGDDMKPKSEE
jgi:CheY-like chemotaxis protein